MNIENSNLYKRVVNESNIYSAIYSVESYIFEKGLLSSEDIIKLNRLSDKYDFNYIEKVIGECKEELQKIFTDPNYFYETTVYFKLKKYDRENDIVSFRPLHTANLTTQICIVCMLNVIMFEDSDEGRNLSDISKLLLSNFFGNIPSTNVDSLFLPWKLKYKEYSDSVIAAFHEYRSTNKYKYEVSLDLKQFFPSVNPIIIYSFIIEKLSVLYAGIDLECLKILVKKLLYFKLQGINTLDKNYYGDFLADTISDGGLFSLGIPQGLPQSYFFGNLCMIDVAKIINNEFKGESFYYVDDSVIFTNEIKDNFPSNLEAINEKLRDLQDVQHKPDLPDSINKFEKNIRYCISVHTGEKSSYTKIAEGNYGLSNLLLITKNVSNIPFEMSVTIDEIEDTTISEKITTILDAIKKEIELIKIKQQSSKKNIYDPYLKLLIRYQKFYLFRLRVVLLRDDNSVETFEKKYYETYSFLQDNNFDKAKAFDNIDGGIFLSETHLLLNNLRGDDESRQKLIEEISNFEKRLCPEINNCYYDKDINGATQQQLLLPRTYYTLKNTVYQRIEKFYRSKHEIIRSSISSLISEIENENYTSHKYTIAKFLHLHKPSIEFVYNTSNNYKRMMLNAIISYYMSVTINDSCNFIKEDNRAITYFEIRLLMFLRNQSSSVSKFIHFSKHIIAEYDKGQWYEKIDFTLLEVLPLFKQYVKESKEVDTLILIHKYVNGLWKNGSKFLHFYTLHNEEHSVELVKLCLRITKSIDYFKLKERDYFILFAACYLHDISMVLYPNIDRFTEDKFNTDAIYTQWKDDLRKLKFEDCSRSDAKRFILNYFEKVNSYFEVESRESHP